MKPSDIGILVVDDEASVRDALHKWFEFDGYRVDSAADATIALQKLQDATWDIVLLDTTGRFLFLFNPQNSRVYIHPHENVLTIRKEAPALPELPSDSGR